MYELPRQIHYPYVRRHQGSSPQRHHQTRQQSPRGACVSSRRELLLAKWSETGTCAEAYLRKHQSKEQGSDYRHTQKHKVVPPADGCKSIGSGTEQYQGRNEETRDRDGTTTSSQMRRPDLGSIHVCRRVEARGITRTLSAKPVLDTLFFQAWSMLERPRQMSRYHLQANMEEQEEHCCTVASAIAGVLIKCKHDDLEH